VNSRRGPGPDPLSSAPAFDVGDAVNNFVFAKLAHARAADALNLDEQWIALRHYLTFFLDDM